MPKQVFLRLDVPESHGGTAYYRLNQPMRGFLNRCREQFGDIEGVVLNKEEDGSYDWTIGFILPPRP